MESPVLDINFFRNNRIVAFSNLAALISYSATFTVTFLLSLYMEYIKVLSPQNAGLILPCQPFMMATFSPFTGRLSDRVEPRIIASAGMGLTVVSLSLFALLNKKTNLEFVVISLILLGFGVALISSPNTNAVMSPVERKFLWNISCKAWNNAVNWTNVQCGHYNVDICHIHREASNYSSTLLNVFNMCENNIHRLCCPMFRRHIYIICKR